LFIKHQDISKLPASLLLSVDNTQYRIFITHETITCFTCKSAGHTSATCDKLVESADNNQSSLNLKTALIQEQTNSDYSIETEPPTSIISNLDEELSATPSPTQNEAYKRPISVSSSLRPPDSPNNLISSITTIKKEKTLKKAKIRSRSNSANRSNNSPDEGLKLIEEYFTNNNQLPITYPQFIYIFDNFSNKSINIHTLTEEANIDIPNLMDLIDQIRILIKDRTLKGRITKLNNLLFQTQPPQ